VATQTWVSCILLSHSNYLQHLIPRGQTDDGNTATSSATSLASNPLTTLSAMEQPFNYRIVLLDENSTAVAVADTLEEIRVDWNWIASHLLPKVYRVENK